MVAQQRLLHLLREAAVATPVIGRGAAAMRDDEAQGRKILEEIALDQLHDRGRVGVDVMRAGRMEAGIAAGRDVYHGRNVVFHHLLVDRIPVPVGQRRAPPVAAGRIRVQVDADEAVVLHAFLEFGNTCRGIDAGALRQHGRADEIVRQQGGDAVNQLVADRRPGRGHLEVADVVGHEARARRKDGEVRATLLHLAQLVFLDGFPQLVVANLQLRNLRHGGGIVDRGDLAIAPILQRLGRGGVVAVTVDDHPAFLSLAGRRRRRAAAVMDRL